MEGDRRRLTLRAALAGQLGGGLSTDRLSRLRRDFACDELAREAAVRVQEMRLQINAAALAGAPENFSHYWRRANQLLLQAQALVFGQEPAAHDPAAVADAMQKEYVAKFGDPADPEVQERMRALIEAWEREDSALVA